LWLKKKVTRLTNNPKGFSSIVGSVFMVSVVLILSTGVFLWTLEQNTSYNDTIRQTNQLEADRLSESLNVLSTTYSVNANGKVTVAAQIQNTGPSSIQFMTVWIKVSNSTPWTNYNFSNLTNANVQSGAIFPLNVSLSVSGVLVNSSASYTFASWLITTRGNAVALQQKTITSIISVSQTTQGIGALMMDFPNFTYYNVTGSDPYFLNLTAGASGYYVQGAAEPKGQVAFRVILTNLDQNQRNITLASGSVLFFIFPSATGAFQGVAWYVVNVNGQTGAISKTYTSVTLVYNVATSVYFASGQPGTFTPKGIPSSFVPSIAPVNLALIGTIGSSPFGQNIPFVSIYIQS
jgi:FlaG/FlaF family flagellin (archaellin)